MCVIYLTIIIDEKYIYIYLKLIKQDQFHIKILIFKCVLCLNACINSKFFCRFMY